MIDLAELAGSLLDLGVQVLEEAGADDPPARPAPAQRFVGHGSITWDCELLAVHVPRVAPKVIDPRNEACAVVPEAMLHVTLLQCVPKLGPQGQPPTPAEIDESSRQLLVDGRALYGGLLRAWTTRAWPANRDCSMVKWGQLEPLPASGGLGGWRIDLKVQV